MPPSSSSSLLLFLLFPLLRPGGAAEVSGCGAFHTGRPDFVLDAEDAVREGAALLATAHVQSAADCERACCDDERCNLVLLEPRGTAAAADNLTCVLFSCLHRNQFVCRFVNQVGYQTYIRETVFKKYLQGAGRDVIVQPGETVMLNGKESGPLDGAHITKYHWSLQSGDSSVKVESTDLPDQVRLSNLQPGRYTFQLNVTNSNDQTGTAKTIVLVLTPEQSDLYCRAPPKVGPCRAAFRRWRYDAAAGHCEEFVFGGCQPSLNNYLSKNECVSVCRGVAAASERSIPVPVEVCGEACRPDQLTCNNGCCLDRSLECDNVTHCSDASDEDHCTKLNRTLGRLLSIDVNQQRARCTEPPRTGPCRASFPRFYYNPLDRKCYRFTYGGCHGNGNNFEDDQQCSETCNGVTERHVFSRGLFDRFEKEDDGDSGSIALAVCLSVAILALLAILTYCFLKARRKRSHRPVATGPAHVALSEQDTLVYNSTTKPM